jgi:chromosome segregation ATPase
MNACVACRSFAQKATRWDDAAATKLEERRVQLLNDLQNLPDYHRIQTQEGEVRRNINEARFKLNSCAESVRIARMKVAKRQQGLKELKDLIAQKKPQLKACKQELSVSSKKVCATCVSEN